MKVSYRPLFKWTACAVVASTILGPSLAPVWAEGGNKRTRGNWGINRRVATNEGYAEVDGTVDLAFGIPTGASGAIDEWQHFADSPTFYLGADMGHPIDAGLQYDLDGPRRGMVHIDNDPTTFVSRRGWHCFIRNNNSAIPDAQRYKFLSYWDQTNSTSARWNTYQAYPGDPVFPSTGITNAHLHFSIHQGIDPPVGSSTDAFVEQLGWISLSFNRWELGARTQVAPPGMSPGPTSQAAYLAGDRKAYWVADATLPPRLTARVQSGGQQNSNTVTITAQAGVISTVGVGDSITIGADANLRIIQKTIVNPTTATLVVGGNFAVNHVGPPNPQEVECFFFSKTTLTTAVTIPAPPAAVNTIEVASVIGIRPADDVRVGGEWMTVASVDNFNNSLTFTGNLTSNHNVGEIIGWQQDIGYAHDNHPVAPWFGQVAYDPATPPAPSTWHVKRVIGMTRASGAAGTTGDNANWAETLDGS